MLQRLRRRWGASTKARDDDELSNDIVRYRGISVASLSRIWRSILDNSDVELYVVSAEHADEALAGKTFRRSATLPDGAMTGSVAYVSGEVRLRDGDASPKARDAWTIEDVCEYFVLPTTRPTGGFFLSTLRGKGEVGKPFQGAFVSQARQTRFGDLVAALEAHFAGAPAAEQFVWLDLFSANQPKLTGADSGSPRVMSQRYDLLTKGLHAAIERFEQRLIFFDSWRAPAPLGRMWCVWEVYGAVRAAKELALVFAPGQADAFVQQVLRDPAEITRALSQFEMRDAQCHSAADRDMINAAVEALPGGFPALNGAVLHKLRAWLAKTASDVAQQHAAREPDALETAALSAAVALLLQELGDLDGAERLSRHALQLKRAKLGDEDPAVAASMHLLARVLLDKGDYDGAVELHEKALAVKRDKLGRRHVQVAVTMQNMAIALTARGEVDASLAIYEEALAIYTERLGPTHAWVATTMVNYAGALRKSGQLERAMGMYEEALVVMQGAPGSKHPSVATTMAHTADLHLELGESDAAKELYERALLIYREQLGDEHPSVQAIEHKLEQIES